MPSLVYTNSSSKYLINHESESTYCNQDHRRRRGFFGSSLRNFLQPSEAAQPFGAKFPQLDSLTTGEWWTKGAGAKTQLKGSGAQGGRAADGCAA